MRVTWSPRAIRRVVEHAEYIALDKPGAAERWLEGAFEAAEPLGDFPRSGRIVPELDREDFREVLYGAYRIIYRVFAGEKVVVLRARAKITAAFGRNSINPRGVALPAA